MTALAILEQQASAEITFHAKLIGLRIDISLDKDPERYYNELRKLLLEFVENAGFGEITKSFKDVSKYIGERGY